MTDGETSWGAFVVWWWPFRGRVVVAVLRCFHFESAANAAERRRASLSRSGTARRHGQAWCPHLPQPGSAPSFWFVGRSRLDPCRPRGLGRGTSLPRSRPGRARRGAREARRGGVPGPQLDQVGHSPPRSHPSSSSHSLHSARPLSLSVQSFVSLSAPAYLVIVGSLRTLTHARREEG